MRYLRSLPRNRRELVTKKLQQYASDPQSLENNITALKGSELLRLRIGNLRVILRLEDDAISIVEIMARGSGYRLP